VHYKLYFKTNDPLLPLRDSKPTQRWALFLLLFLQELLQLRLLLLVAVRTDTTKLDNRQVLVHLWKPQADAPLCQVAV
jgi:hypothetical protein